MNINDDFVIIVPRDARKVPFLVDPTSDLSEYVGEFIRVSKTVQRYQGKSVSGSVYRGRETTVSDELTIMDLISATFRG